MEPRTGTRVRLGAARAPGPAPAGRAGRLGASLLRSPALVLTLDRTPDASPGLRGPAKEASLRAPWPRAAGGGTPIPIAPTGPLTLDLLVDHQGEVVQLQDVRELAQRVRQADLEEKRPSALPGRPAGPLAGGAQERPGFALEQSCVAFC